MEGAIKFIQKDNFDGLDLDFAYPGKMGRVSEDKKKLNNLHAVFTQKLLLTAIEGVPQDMVLMKIYKYLVHLTATMGDTQGTIDENG